MLNRIEQYKLPLKRTNESTSNDEQDNISATDYCFGRRATVTSDKQDQRDGLPFQPQGKPAVTRDERIESGGLPLRPDHLQRARGAQRARWTTNSAAAHPPTERKHYEGPFQPSCFGEEQALKQ